MGWHGNGDGYGLIGEVGFPRSLNHGQSCYLFLMFLCCCVYYICLFFLSSLFHFLHICTSLSLFSLISSLEESSLNGRHNQPPQSTHSGFFHVSAYYAIQGPRPMDNSFFRSFSSFPTVPRWYIGIQYQYQYTYHVFFPCLCFIVHLSVQVCVLGMCKQSYDPLSSRLSVCFFPMFLINRVSLQLRFVIYALVFPRFLPFCGINTSFLIYASLSTVKVE